MGRSYVDDWKKEKQEIKVNITYKILNNEESEKLLQFVKTWYVENFMMWFEKQIKDANGDKIN